MTKVIRYFAVFLIAHLVWVAFGMPPLWVPVEPGSAREILLVFVHLFAFWLAAMTFA